MKNNEEFVDVVNWIIDKTIKPYQGELLVNLKFYLDKKNKYVLEYTIIKDYYSDYVLRSGCYYTTEDILRWFDITDIIYNFDIKIYTPTKTMTMSYYDLMNEIVVKSVLLDNHPRKEKYEMWLSEDEKRYHQIFHINYILKNKKSFFGRIKDFVLSLWSKKIGISDSFRRYVTIYYKRKKWDDQENTH